MKKLIALVLALAMVATLGLAFADGEPNYNVTVTVNGISEGNTLKLYKIAGAAIAADNTITYTYATGLPDAYDTVEEIGAVTDSADITAMANAFAAVFGGGTADYSPVATASGEASTTVAPGYYFGIVSGNNDSSVVYKSMLINAVPVAATDGSGWSAHEAVSITAKKETITVTKSEPDPTTAAASARTTDGYSQGDEIPFTITTSFPNYPSNSLNATFVVKDTPDGLDDKIESVQVFINGSETATAAADGTFAVARSSEHGFTVTFVKQFILDHAGQSVVVKYNGELIAPVTLAGGLSNTASITYNPNPFENTTVEPDDTVTQKVYGVVVYKYEDGDSTKKLTGAEFELYNATVEGTTVTLGTKVKDATAVNADGLLVWENLKNGTYAIVETKAPAGYRLDSAPHAITLNATTATGDNPLTAATETYFLRSEIPNTKGASLPSTGGIGTTIFYIVGGLLVIGAAVILVARRKAHD